MREVEDHTIVHIGLFSRYVKDLHRFVKTVVKPMAKDLPLYLYAHSMGGCIGAFYLEQYPEDFAKAVLNAPMLGVNLGGVPSWAARVLCDFKVFGGNGKDRLLTQGTFDPEESFSDASCSSEARHDYYMKNGGRMKAARPLQEAMNGAGKRSMPGNLSSAKSRRKR